MILNRRKFQSSKIREKRKRDRLIKFSVISFISILFLGAIAYLSRLDSIVISDIEVEGNSITSTSEIEEIVLDELTGSYFFLLPRNSSVLYSRNGIKEGIMAEIERVRNVELSVRDLETLVVRVFEREPNATWCHGENCYFMDISGLVYSEAPSFSGDVFLKYFGFISGNPIGKQYLDKEYFSKLSSFIKDLDLEAVSVSIDEFDDIEIALKNGKLIFNKDQDLTSLSNDLGSIFSDESFSIQFEGGQELDYIDLRFGNKVFFQFK